MPLMLRPRQRRFVRVNQTSSAPIIPRQSARPNSGAAKRQKRGPKNERDGDASVPSLVRMKFRLKPGRLYEVDEVLSRVAD